MGRAGAETALIELLERLDALKVYELYLYVIIPNGELHNKIPKNVILLNRKIYRNAPLSILGVLQIIGLTIQSFFYKLTGFRMLPYILQNIREQRLTGGKFQYDKLLWRILSEGRPDLKGQYDLGVAYIEGAATYFMADKVNAKKKAAFVHIDYKKSGYTPFMDQNSYDSMDKIFVVSNGVGEKFGEVYPMYKEKIKLFRNLLNKESIIHKSEQGEGFKDGFSGIRLLTVGRLHYQKAYDIAILILEQLLKDGYIIRWYVIGEGNERGRLEKLIKSKGLENSFILLGAKNNPYVYMKQADIYIQATRFEGKSIAVEEAQILGKTIIASDCTGNCEQIISGYDGILLPLTVEDFRRGLIEVIEDSQLRNTLGKHAKEKQLDYPEDLNEMLHMLS